MPRPAAALLATLVVALLAAPDAGANVALSNVQARPCAGTTAAGSHPDLCVAFDVGQTGGDDLRDLTIHLAPGLLGDPSATPTCPQATFRTGDCPAGTQVGAIETNATATIVVVPTPLTLSGSVYNVAPNADEPARLGIRIEGSGGLTAPIRLEAGVRVRPADFGLDSVSRDLPRESSGFPIEITRMKLTLWGSPADHPTLGKPFIALPTSCAPATTSIEPTAYDGTATGGADAFTPVACDKQPYAPRFSASIGTPGATAQGSHPQLRTVIAQEPGEANTAVASVLLPAGVGADLGALGRACPEATLAAGGCPPSAKVGTVVGRTSLLPFPLTGDILFVAPAGGTLPALSLELPLGLRLRATVSLTGGRLQTDFPVVPDVPLQSLELTLLGGPAGVLVAGRDLCAGPAPTFGARFTSHGGAARESTVAADVPCRPALAVTGRLARARSARPTLSLTATASGTRLRALRVSLPRQLGLVNVRTLRRHARVVVDGRRAAARSLSVLRGRLAVGRLPAAGAGRIVVSLRAGALQRRGRIAPGRGVTARVQGLPVSGPALTRSLRLRG